MASLISRVIPVQILAVASGWLGSSKTSSSGSFGSTFLSAYSSRISPSARGHSGGVRGRPAHFSFLPRWWLPLQYYQSLHTRLVPHYPSTYWWFHRASLALSLLVVLLPRFLLPCLLLLLPPTLESFENGLSQAYEGHVKFIKIPQKVPLLTLCFTYLWSCSQQLGSSVLDLQTQRKHGEIGAVVVAREPPMP